MTIQVIIITNSDEGWVKYSAERYLPNLIPVLKNYRIISARTRYEKFYPNQPLCWKAAAFAHEVNEHFCSLEEVHDLLDRECGHRLLSGGINAPSSDGDSVQDLDMASTDVSSHDDSSLDDGSLSSESPGGGGDGWANPVGGGSPASTGPSAVAPHPPPSSRSRDSIRREIVSFGDSVEERTAVRIVSDQLDAVPKSVKFLNNPTPSQIIGQLVMCTHHMAYVCGHDGDLDLEISTRQAEKCATGYLGRRGLAGGVTHASRTTGGGGGASPSILQRILGGTNHQDPPSADSSDDADARMM
jgi:hypothetical protein